MNYWGECIREAFEDAEIVATEEQIQNVIGWVEGAHENWGMATGHDVAQANFISKEAGELEELKREIEKQRIWECQTVPCKTCTTTGTEQDGWGRDVTCSTCDGKGRHK